MKFIEEMPVNITDYLVFKRDAAIKHIMSLLDMSDISGEHRVKVRKAVLEELNEFYNASLKVLVFIQEE